MAQQKCRRCKQSFDENDMHKELGLFGWIYHCWPCWNLLNNFGKKE